MRAALVLLVALAGCSDDELGKQQQPVRDPADYQLSADDARAAIEAHDGDGCLRMDPFVPCRGCAPRYRLVAIATGANVGPCGRSTFVAGREVLTADAPRGSAYTWTCLAGPLGGAWSNGAIDMVGALTCRE